MKEVIAALSAGIVSSILCNPLDVIRVNYQLKNKIKLDRSIFYKGINYGIIAIPSFWVTYFPLNNQFKNYLNDSLAAYFACCVSSTITTPFWVLKQKAQTDVPINIISLRSLYNGLIPTYFINLNFTVQMPLYEYLKDKYGTGTTSIFIISAFSKTIATCIFYPLDTIRVKIRNGDPFIGINYYRGISIYLLRSIPYYASIFCTYEFIKKII